jgi:hypothetical protein
VVLVVGAAVVVVVSGAAVVVVVGRAVATVVGGRTVEVVTRRAVVAVVAGGGGAVAGGRDVAVVDGGRVVLAVDGTLAPSAGAEGTVGWVAGGPDAGGVGAGEVGAGEVGADPAVRSAARPPTVPGPVLDSTSREIPRIVAKAVRAARCRTRFTARTPRRGCAGRARRPSVAPPAPP